MIIDRRHLRFETVPPQPHSSVAVAEIKEDYFAFKWHCHSEIELNYVVKGSGYRFVGNAIRLFEPGDLCLLGTFVPHSWQSAPARGSVYAITTHFNQEDWGGFLQLPEMRRVNRLLSDEACRGIQVVGKTAEVVASLMTHLQQERRGSISRLQILIELLTRITDCPDDRNIIGTRDFGPQHNSTDAVVVAKAIAILRDSLGDVLPSQAELADQLSMTPSTFSRVFRQCVGKNFTEYLNEWRVSLACRALLETDDPIIDVSLAAGFENVSNFHRRFREQTGKTPAQWRVEARSAGTQRYE